MAAAALRMPSHYVPVEAEEMEYVEGGKVWIDSTFSRSTSVAFSLLDNLGFSCEVGAWAAGLAITLIGTGLGALIGGIPGAVVGGIIGLIAGIVSGSIIYGWAAAFNSAAATAYNMMNAGISSCSIHIQLINTSFVVSVG